MATRATAPMIIGSTTAEMIRSLQGAGPAVQVADQGQPLPPASSVRRHRLNDPTRTLLLLRPRQIELGRPGAGRFGPAAGAARRDGRAGDGSRDGAAAAGKPELALVSPSRRTRETWALVAPHLAEPPAEVFPERLYMAGADDLMSLVREAASPCRNPARVGHNPGIEDFAALLAGDGSVGPRRWTGCGPSSRPAR